MSVFGKAVLKKWSHILFGFVDFGFDFERGF